MKLKKHFYKNLGISLVTTEEAEFLDHQSPVFNELTKEEFSGLIKGLNIIYDLPHFSADSNEFKKLREKYEKEYLTKGKKSCASWMGRFLGFREID